MLLIIVLIHSRDLCEIDIFNINLFCFIIFILLFFYSLYFYIINVVFVSHIYRLLQIVSIIMFHFRKWTNPAVAISSGASVRQHKYVMHRLGGHQWRV